MASPFKVFRKNQKAMLALLTILTMFSFLFIPILMDMMGLRSGGPENPVVAKTSKFGSIKLRDLQHLRESHRKVVMVMTDLKRVAADAEIKDLIKTGKIPEAYESQLRANAERQAVQEAESMFGPPTEESLVSTWLMARYAEQEGVIVSDKAINHFLFDVETRNRVTANQMKETFQRAGISVETFFSLLRHELLAQQVQRIMQPAMSPVAATPAERWDYYNRLNRYAMIEAVAVPVADPALLKQVPKPTDAQLKAFFDEHKGEIARPESPEPGFRRPHRVALEYVRADIEKFTKAITDQQVREQYEKEKDRYDQVTEQRAKQKAAAEAQKKAAQQPEKTPAVKGQTKSESAKPSQQPLKAGQQQPGKPAPAAPKQPATPKAAAPTKEPNKPKDSKSTSENNLPIPSEGLEGARVQLASFAEEKKEDKKPDAAGAKTPVAKPVTPALATPPGKPGAPAAKSAGLGLTDELKKDIRQELAAEKVRKIFAELKEEIGQYSEKRREYDVLKIHAAEQKKSIEPPPPEPNFEKFAKENGLTAGRSGLIPQWEMQGKDIGQSFIGSGAYVWSYAFRGLGTTFRCETSQDTKGDAFLFWKTGDEKEYEPKFDDAGVRAEVLREWNLIQARDIAMKAAQKLAAEAKKANKSLRQVFPDRHVILPAKFTWLNFPSVASQWQQPARLSTVDGVEMPGWDFMREVFGLQENEVGVAFNAPKTIVYLVRPAEFTPSYKVLRPLFVAEPYAKYYAAGQEDVAKMWRAWFDELKRSAGFAWGPGHRIDRPSDYGPMSGD
ncbi:MAG: hypothetical protein LLG00_16075 [Planctomycetaceae bacterium]|nr:hypothetical protein [Planctomycetaceae bacterium]